MLKDARFEEIRGGGKGAHRKFTHQSFPGAVTISGKPGDDAKPYQLQQVEKAISPNISPIRLLASDRCLLSMSYDNLSSMLPLHTALDAPSLVFFALAGTCSLNQKNHYAFGHEHPLTQKILSDHRINW